MWSVIHLSILLTLSGFFAECGGLKISSHKKPELKTLPSIMRDQMITAPPKWQKNPVICCSCQDFVKITKPKVDKQIQLKLTNFCRMFINSVEKKCLTFGTKLKNKILQSVFPGKTPRETCKMKVKLCMY